jgi:hypothetical protein
MTTRTVRGALAAGLAAGLLGLALPAGGQGATCTVQLDPRIIGGGGLVQTTSVARNVDRRQAFAATCTTARQVVHAAVGLYFVNPIRTRFAVLGFATVARRVSTGPTIVRYVATFRGADTATFVRLRFSVRYEAAGGARAASTPEAELMTRAVVTGLSRIPADRYDVTRLRISNNDESYGAGFIQPLPQYASTIQATDVLLRERQGTWRVLDVGEIGCDLAPRPVLDSLFRGCVPA